MSPIEQTTSIQGPPTRPGLTSLLRTGRGLMTVQTEIVGTPAQFVTFVDYRGRVLKTWKSPLASTVDDSQLSTLARLWHQDVEARVRESLARAGQRSPNHGIGEVLAHLFVAAMQAYAKRDLVTARDVLRAYDLLRPDDARVRAALKRLSTERGLAPGRGPGLAVSRFH